MPITTGDGTVYKDEFAAIVDIPESRFDGNKFLPIINSGESQTDPYAEAPLKITVTPMVNKGEPSLDKLIRENTPVEVQRQGPLEIDPTDPGDSHIGPMEALSEMETAGKINWFNPEMFRQSSKAKQIDQPIDTRPIDEINDYINRNAYYFKQRISELFPIAGEYEQDIDSTYNSIIKDSKGNVAISNIQKFLNKEASNKAVEVFGNSENPVSFKASDYKDVWWEPKVKNDLPTLVTPPEPKKPELPESIKKLFGLDGRERYQTWPEKLIRSSLDALKLPGDVYTGKTEITDPALIKRVTDLAGLIVLAPAPIAHKVVDGTLGIMGGVSSKTLNREAFKRAREYEQLGLSADDIYYATGFFKGIDDRWRYEISDVAAKLNRNAAEPVELRWLKMMDEVAAAKTEEQKLFIIAKFENNNDIKATTLEDVLHHPELFKAYPELKKVFYEVDNDLPKDTFALFNTIDHIISMNMDAIRSNGENVKSILLHEIQHWVQQRETFSGGTSPEEIALKIASALKKRWDNAKTLEEKKKIERVIKDSVGKWETIGNTAYWKSLGEVEARQVERRSHMDMFNVPPYRDLDVDEIFHLGTTAGKTLSKID